MGMFIASYLNRICILSFIEVYNKRMLFKDPYEKNSYHLQSPIRIKRRGQPVTEKRVYGPIDGC